MSFVDTIFRTEKITSSITSLYTLKLTLRYNRLVGSCQQLAHRLSLLDPNDPYRIAHEKKLLDKLYNIGVINSKMKVSDIQTKLSVSAFCRRRIAVVMTRLKMSETVSSGVKFVEQGHVRVGPEVITDPAYLVPRYLSLSDYG